MGGFVRTWVSLFMLWWAEEGGFGGFVRKWVSFFMGWFVKAALTVVGVKLALSSDCRDTTTIAIGASLLVLAVIFCVELATRSDERVAATTMNGC